MKKIIQEEDSGTLERLFGGATSRILDFLSVFRDYDYSKQDIAKNSGVSLRHTILNLEKLEKLKLVKHTRNVGNSPMYKFNTDSSTAMLLQKFALHLAFDECKEIGVQEEQEKQECDRRAITVQYSIDTPMQVQAVSNF
jgi:hypothetical protein